MYAYISCIFTCEHRRNKSEDNTQERARALLTNANVNPSVLTHP